MEYYSVSKKKDIRANVTTWVNIEDNMLSEISQPQKDKYRMIPLIWGTKSSQKSENQKIEWWFSDPRGRGESGVILYGYRVIQFQFYKMKRAMETSSADACTLWMYLVPLNSTLKNG